MNLVSVCVFAWMYRLGGRMRLTPKMYNISTFYIHGFWSPCCGQSKKMIQSDKLIEGKRHSHMRSGQNLQESFA